MVRSIVENGSRLAKAHGDYVILGAPLPILEGAACTGAYAGWVACPGWRSSTDPADVAALQDPDLARVSSVYVAGTANIDNVSLVFAPDGTLYDLQPKVNLTPLEISPLGWHAAAPATIHAIGLHGADATALPQVRLGIAISLDGFVTAAATGDPCGTAATYLACLDSKGVNVVLQPDFNDGVTPCWSWTDFTEDCGTAQASWQPLSWMRSTWFQVQGRRTDGSFAFALSPTQSTPSRWATSSTSAATGRRPSLRAVTLAPQRRGTRGTAAARCTRLQGRARTVPTIPVMPATRDRCLVSWR